MLWGKQKKLELLFSELAGIALLDRLYASQPELTDSERQAYEKRESRRSQLLTEIERLSAPQDLHWGS
jgi:hypothetical protein